MVDLSVPRACMTLVHHCTHDKVYTAGSIVRHNLVTLELERQDVDELLEGKNPSQRRVIELTAATATVTLVSCTSEWLRSEEQPHGSTSDSR